MALLVTRNGRLIITWLFGKEGERLLLPLM